MGLKSINPVNGTLNEVVESWSDVQMQQALGRAAYAVPFWSAMTIGGRCTLVARLAAILRTRSSELARLISLEMGKITREAEAEIEKCAVLCDYYAERAPDFLADEVIESDAGRSYVAYQPLGSVLAIMPWNFPFWQVFRFAIPTILVGNTCLLKHAANVPGCARAIEQLFHEAGFPDGAFISLMIQAGQVQAVIEDDRVHAVSLTGSESVGRKVAASAGASLKKCVLELGGSDAFIVLEDADLELAVETAVQSRFLNAGQSCIAAKRFIVVEQIAERFVEAFAAAASRLRMGDPLDPETTLAPMARVDLRDELHQQVTLSIARGAVAVTGCRPPSGPGAYYPPSVLDQVVAGMPAFEDELFGPVASILRVKDEDAAIAVANRSRYGLGGSIWTGDLCRGEGLALKMASGAVFVNGLVKSDARLPFGGIKASGYGRELSLLGIREFVNAKTVWIR